VAEIAGEKAAIIKEGSHAVTAASDAEALSVIERRAAEVAAPLLVAGRDIAVEVLSHDVGSQRLELRGPHSAVQVDLPLAGDHQAANAAAAFGAAEALRDRGIQIDDRALKRGFEAVYAPGRFEVVSREPMIVLDGAHNPAAARALARAITSWLPGRKLVLLFAAMQDKDAESMARELGPLAEVVIVTRVPHTERAASLARLAQSFAPWHANVVVEDDADRGLEHALARVGQGSFVLVTGSMYLVGYTRRLLRTRTLAR
jgi:dihydrofolate synthase/folylpolyglutamate synthase